MVYILKMNENEFEFLFHRSIFIHGQVLQVGSHDPLRVYDKMNELTNGLPDM